MKGFDASHVVMRVDGQVEIDCEEEFELECVQFLDGQPAQFCPVSVQANYVIEVLGCNESGDEQQALKGP